MNQTQLQTHRICLENKSRGYPYFCNRICFTVNSIVSWRQRDQFLPYWEAASTAVLIAYPVRLYLIDWVRSLPSPTGKMTYSLVLHRDNPSKDRTFSFHLWCSWLWMSTLCEKNRLVRCYLLYSVVLWTYFFTCLNFTKHQNNEYWIADNALYFPLNALWDQLDAGKIFFKIQSHFNRLGLVLKNTRVWKSLNTSSICFRFIVFLLTESLLIMW